MGTLPEPVTRWNDYTGTAVADDAYVVPGKHSLYALAGVDRDRWIIVAIDLVLASPANAVTVYAADRQEAAASHHLTNGDSGGLTVAAFSITDPRSVATFMAGAFDRVAVRLVSRPFGGTPLFLADTVADRRGHPSVAVSALNEQDLGSLQTGSLSAPLPVTSTAES